MTGITVLKLGGELLEPHDRLSAIAGLIAEARRHAPRLAVVHGGGRTIDAALKKSGIAPRQVNGLRITDEETLDVVVSTLAGLINTRFVAALNAAGTPAVGLTGADGSLLPVRTADPVRDLDGRQVSLGRVGEPDEHGRTALAMQLIDAGFVPVIASIAADASGALLNVNADTFAAALAVALRAERLVIAGTTAGVLDRAGATIPSMTLADAEALVSDGSATAGMIAKLRACTSAAERGVASVVITEGSALAHVMAARSALQGTTIQSMAAVGGLNA